MQTTLRSEAHYSQANFILQYFLTKVISSNPSSPYCPPPADVSQAQAQVLHKTGPSQFNRQASV